MGEMRSGALPAIAAPPPPCYPQQFPSPCLGGGAFKEPGRPRPADRLGARVPRLLVFAWPHRFNTVEKHALALRAKGLVDGSGGTRPPVSARSHSSAALREVANVFEDNSEQALLRGFCGPHAAIANDSERAPGTPMRRRSGLGAKRQGKDRITSFQRVASSWPDPSPRCRRAWAPSFSKSRRLGR